MILLVAASWAQATSYEFTADSTKAFTLEVTASSISISDLVFTYDETQGYPDWMDSTGLYEYTLTTGEGLGLWQGTDLFFLNLEAGYSQVLGTYAGLDWGQEAVWSGLSFSQGLFTLADLSLTYLFSVGTDANAIKVAQHCPEGIFIN